MHRVFSGWILPAIAAVTAIAAATPSASAQFMDSLSGIGDAIVGTASEDGSRGTGVFGNVQLLSLTPRIGTAAYGIFDESDNGSPEGGVLSIQPDSDLGLRFILGHAFGDGWDITFTYTGIDWNDYQHRVAPPGGVIQATRRRANLGAAEASEATDKLSIDYQVIDLETGNRLQLSDNTLLRLLFGFRYARINREETVGYSGLDNADGTIVVDNVNIEGWGLRVGGEVHRQLGLGVSVFGRSSASLLIGEVTGLHAEEYGDGGGYDDDFRTNYTQALPVVDAAVGLNWQYRALDFAFGYELANWFNLPQSAFFNDDTHNSQFTQVNENLLIDGFFFRFGITR